MNTATWVAIPFAYLLGTFPSASLFARAAGIDITKVGSGNPGASNISRSLGWRKGVWVFVLDAAKGAICAAAGLVIAGRPAGYTLAGAAIIGHILPIGRRLRGGKGVATGGGAFAVLSPIVLIRGVALWLAVSRLTKLASLASILAVAVLPIGMVVVGRDLWEVLTTIGLCAIVMSRHIGNMRRLVTATEHRI